MLNQTIKAARLYVAVEDMTRTPVNIVGTHPLKWGRGGDPTVGLAEIGSDLIGILWAIATHDTTYLQRVTDHHSCGSALLAELACEKILQEIADISLPEAQP